MSPGSDHCPGRDALPSAGSQVCTDRGEQMMDKGTGKGYNNQMYGTYTYRVGSISRKRQIIDRMMNDLHTQQLDFIDQAVDASDLSDAKALISWIMQKQ